MNRECVYYIHDNRNIHEPIVLDTTIFVSDLRHVGNFLRILRFPQPKNWPPRYNWTIVESGVKHITLTHENILVLSLICNVLHFYQCQLFLFCISGSSITISVSTFCQLLHVTPLQKKKKKKRNNYKINIEKSKRQSL